MAGYIDRKEFTGKACNFEPLAIVALFCHSKKQFQEGVVLFRKRDKTNLYWSCSLLFAQPALQYSGAMRESTNFQRKENLPVLSMFIIRKSLNDLPIRSSDIISTTSESSRKLSKGSGSL